MLHGKSQKIVFKNSNLYSARLKEEESSPLTPAYNCSGSSLQGYEKLIRIMSRQQKQTLVKNPIEYKWLLVSV